MFFPVFTDCGTNEYYCPSLNMCITCCSLVIQCNEVPISISCPDCPENGFRCDKSKLCIDSFSVCDGKDDCDDGSDERNCGTNTAWENEKFTLTEKKFRQINYIV